MKHSFRNTSITYIIFALVLLISIGLLLAKVGVLPGLSSNPNRNTTSATSFTENFQSTARNWTTGTNGGLISGIVNNRYDIQISGGPATYFPHPDVGTLPSNFILTVTMEQTQGRPNSWFGLAFRENDDGNGGNVTCYAFGVQTNGISTVQKYDPNVTNHTTTLGGSTNPVPGFKTGNNRLHTIQAIVHGNTFLFKVDNQIVPVSAATDKSITDTQYNGGHLTLYVSGSNAAFIVTSVQLAVQ